MDEEIFNTGLRKFLRRVGVTSQQEIEKAVRAAIEAGRLKGNEKLSVKNRTEAVTLASRYGLV